LVRRRHQRAGGPTGRDSHGVHASHRSAARCATATSAAPCPAPSGPRPPTVAPTPRRSPEAVDADFEDTARLAGPDGRVPARAAMRPHPAAACRHRVHLPPPPARPGPGVALDEEGEERREHAQPVVEVCVAGGTGSGRSTEVVWRAGPVGITRVERPHPIRIASDELTCEPRHYLPVSTSPPAH
jgi:hypothetical protein